MRSSESIRRFYLLATCVGDILVRGNNTTMPAARRNGIGGLPVGGTGIELGAKRTETCDAVRTCKLSRGLRSLSRSVWFRLVPCRGGFRGNQVATSGTASPRTELDLVIDRSPNRRAVRNFFPSR